MILGNTFVASEFTGSLLQHITNCIIARQVLAPSYIEERVQHNPYVIPLDDDARIKFNLDTDTLATPYIQRGDSIITYDNNKYYIYIIK